MKYLQPNSHMGLVRTCSADSWRKPCRRLRKSVAEDGRVHPKVGVVVVKDGKELATAHRGEQGKGEHAEYIALERKLGDEAVVGATVYTTLEPCTTRNHPKVPCAERLVERKVKRVVIGMLDPNSTVSGKGFQKLRDSNTAIWLFDPDLMSEVEEMNRDFVRQHRSKHYDSIAAKPNWTFFIGQWRVGHGPGMPGLSLITLSDDYGATKSNVPEASGVWEYVNGEARITWSDGWKDILRCTPEGVLKLAFDRGATFAPTPTNFSSAKRMA